MESVLTVTNAADSKRYRIVVKGSLERITGAKLKKYMQSYVGAGAAAMTLRFRGRDFADTSRCDDVGVRSGDTLMLFPPGEDAAELPELPSDNSALSTAHQPHTEVEAALLDEQRSAFSHQKQERDEEFHRALTELESEREEQMRNRMRIESEMRERHDMLKRLDQEREQHEQERRRLDELRIAEEQRQRDREKELAERERLLQEERERQRAVELQRLELERKQQILEQQRLESQLERERVERERREWEERLAQQEREVRERESKLQRDRSEQERRQRELERDKAMLLQQRRLEDERFGRERDLDERRLNEIHNTLRGGTDFSGTRWGADVQGQGNPSAAHAGRRRSAPAAPMGEYGSHGDQLRRAVSDAWATSPPPPAVPAAAFQPPSPIDVQGPHGSDPSPMPNVDSAAAAAACLTDFGASLGQPLHFDSSQTCVVEIDSKYTVLITYDKETERLYLYSSLLTNVPKDGSLRLQLYESLLEGALLGRDMAGGGVGLSVKNDFILMCTSLPLQAIQRHALRCTVPIFVEALRRWRRKVRELLTGMSLPSQSPATLPTDCDAEIQSLRDVASPSVRSDTEGAAEYHALIGVEVTDGVTVDGIPPSEDTNGVIVVRAKGAALHAGIIEHDVITTVNGQRIRDLRDFQHVSQTLVPDNPAHFIVERHGREETIIVRPARGRRRAPDQLLQPRRPGFDDVRQAPPHLAATNYARRD